VTIHARDCGNSIGSGFISDLEKPIIEFTWEEIDAHSQAYGDSFYVFDESKFRENFASLKQAFISRYPQTRLAYSYKTNYTPAICRIVNELGGYAEVVSEMEYDLAIQLGIPGNRIIYNGPYKSSSSVRNALHAGAQINLDSIRDYENVLRFAAEMETRKFSVGVRCNFETPECPNSRFGFDVDSLEFAQVIAGIRNSSNVLVNGLHCHFPNREIDSFRVRTSKLVELAGKLFTAPPGFLDVGGGFYGAMPDSLKQLRNVAPPTFDDYAKVVCEAVLKAYEMCSCPPVLFIEPGTALVADTFRFFTKVISTKKVRGRNIATVAGSIFNISPHARLLHLPVRVIRQTESRERTEPEVYDVAGHTCIESDYLTKRLDGPISVHDFLEYRNLGSYSIVMKPPFILPNFPVLQSVNGSRQLVIAKRGETGKDIFHTFEGI